jgi:hypothetical protein
MVHTSGNLNEKRHTGGLLEYANMEFKIESFKYFLLKILVEISKFKEEKRIFISQASLTLIKDFHELEFLFATVILSFL